MEEELKPAEPDVINNRIEHLLIDKGFTKVQLAEAIGIDYATLRRKLDGDAPWKLNESLALANVLGVELASIFLI